MRRAATETTQAPFHTRSFLWSPLSRPDATAHRRAEQQSAGRSRSAPSGCALSGPSPGEAPDVVGDDQFLERVGGRLRRDGHGDATFSSLSSGYESRYGMRQAERGLKRIERSVSIDPSCSFTIRTRPDRAARLEKSGDAEAADVEFGGNIALRSAVEVIAAGRTGHRHRLRWPGPHSIHPLKATDRSLSSSTAVWHTGWTSGPRGKGPFLLWRTFCRGTLGDHLSFQAGPAPERVERLGVVLQREPVADEHVRVEHAGGEQLGRPLDSCAAPPSSR